jgi:hypothetical protein
VRLGTPIRGVSVHLAGSIRAISCGCEPQEARGLKGEVSGVIVVGNRVTEKGSMVPSHCDVYGFGVDSHCRPRRKRPVRGKFSVYQMVF